jgi:hypothetical protein
MGQNVGKYEFLERKLLKQRDIDRLEREYEGEDGFLTQEKAKLLLQEPEIQKHCSEERIAHTWELLESADMIAIHSFLYSLLQDNNKQQAKQARQGKARFRTTPWISLKALLKPSITATGLKSSRSRKKSGRLSILGKLFRKRWCSK